MSSYIRNYSSFLVALPIFIYGLANFAATVGKASEGIIALTILMVVPKMIKDIPRLPKRIIVFVICILSVFLFEYILFPKNENGIISALIGFLTIGTVGIYCGCQTFNISAVLVYTKNLAYINLIINLIYIIVAREDIDTLSMRFGYGILPSGLVFLVQFLISHKKRYLLLFSFIICLIFIWGSRGCLLVTILFMTIYLFKRYKRKAWVFFIIIALSANLITQGLLELISILPFESFKLRKMVATLSEGVVAASSGRDVLYSYYWDLFLQNPCGLGIGLMDAIDMNYPHNIFIQVAVEFGILGLALTIMLFCLCLIRISNFKGTYFLLMAMVFSIAFGRLIISSNYWFRPEFWFLITLLFLKPTQHKTIPNNYN